MKRPLLLSALLAEDRAASLPRLSKALFPALVSLTVFHASKPRRGARALLVLLASSALASVLGLVRFVQHGASFASRARGPVGHYMTFAGQLLLFSSVAAGVALLARERRTRLLALATLVAGGLALAATYTRSSWIGFAVSLAVLVAVARPRWLPALCALVIVALIAAPPQYRARLTGLLIPRTNGTASAPTCGMPGPACSATTR